MAMHILAGECLAGDIRQLSFDGELIAHPECFIEGPVDIKTLEEFWKARAGYLEENNSEPRKYFENVVPSFEKMINVPDGSEVNLWFEYDLFCQVNMWFVLHLLKEKSARIFRVFPSVRTEDDKWKGFGNLSGEELEKCFADRVEFSEAEVKLGADLWAAYAAQDLDTLELLSKTGADSHPYLEEACQAEIARKRDDRPLETLRRIAGEGETDFGRVFERFVAEEGVYGFGDSQVKSMLERLN